MTDKNAYQALLRAKIAGVIEEASAISKLTHEGVKGTLLEILVSKLFRPLLPADIGVGSGQIIDAKSTLSPQIDIILYDKSILPPIFAEDSIGMGIFPIECVLYTIEVKTTLDINGLKQAHECACKVSEFVHTGGDLPVAAPVHTIFGLKTNIKTYTNAERYMRQYPENQKIAAICVVGSEYSYRRNSSWVSYDRDNKYDEILSFIGGMFNTYKQIISNRPTFKLGSYVVPNCASKTLEPPAKTL